MRNDEINLEKTEKRKQFNYILIWFTYFLFSLKSKLKPTNVLSLNLI